MKPNKLLFSLVVSIGCSAVSPSAMAEDANVCGIEKSLLICGSSLRDGEQILDAMSNPESQVMLTNAGASGLIYSNSDEREAFRKSLEANRMAMKKFADRALRKFHRRRMKADAYEEIRQQFSAGMKTYQSGMELYRAGTWQSKTKGIQAD